MEETEMKETAMGVTKSKQEYKKLKKLFKKAYKASVKENQLEAIVREAKKNFPGYAKAQLAFQKARYNADSVPFAALKRVEADFYEAYAEQLDKCATISSKAGTLRVTFESMLRHAGEWKNEEE